MDRRPGFTPLQRRVSRLLIVGSWTARHWRGLLLSIYGLMLAIAGAIVWAGITSDNSVTLVVGAIIGLALLLRFPRRLAASMVRVGHTRRALPGRTRRALPGPATKR